MDLLRTQQSQASNEHLWRLGLAKNTEISYTEAGGCQKVQAN